MSDLSYNKLEKDIEKKTPNEIINDILEEQYKILSSQFSQEQNWDLVKSYKNMCKIAVKEYFEKK